jgi:hypothetical protein
MNANFIGCLIAIAGMMFALVMGYLIGYNDAKDGRMNERIKELMDKATTIEEHGWGASYENFDREKFAELIVRECIEQGDTLAKHYMDTHPEHEQVMLLASIADYSNEIKKHFGVEL